MRLLDTREQKSPRFLVDAFPDIQIMEMESGDYFSGQDMVIFNGKTIPNPWPRRSRIILEQDDELEWLGLCGPLVEIKIGKDFGIHTEPLERFQDELCRMSEYRRKNPHVCLHAVWCQRGASDEEKRKFNHYCYKYHVWGHIMPVHKLVKFLKDLDQPSSYVEFEPFIKRSHDESTPWGKMFRQIDGVSTQIAMNLDQNADLWLEVKVVDEQLLNEAIGLKKDGTPKKLAKKIKFVLEERVYP